MEDTAKTKPQLIKELEEMRLQVAEMKKGESLRNLSEDAFEESWKRLSDIINFIPDATVVVDNDKRIIAWNQAMEEMTGLKKEDMLGHKSREGTIPFYGERRPSLLELLDSSDEELKSKYEYVERRGNTLYIGTFAPARNGGKGAYIWATGSPLFDANGNRVGAIESIRDVTDHKLAQEELIWKTAFLEAQVEATTDGILVVDSNNRKILINQYLLDLWKVPQHVRDDKDDTSLLQYVTSLTKYPEQFLEKVTYLYEHPNETSMDEVEFKNGMVLDRYSSPVLGKDGKYYGRIWTFRDITGYKRVLEALKESQQKLLDIIDFLPDASFVIGKEGKVIAWNKAIEEMTGIQAADMLGKGNYEYALPFYGVRRPILIDLVFAPCEDIKKKYRFVRQEGDVLLAEASVPVRGGEIRALWGKARPLYDSKGNIVGAIESIRDVTERKQAEESLRESEERYRRMTQCIPDAVWTADLSGRFTYVNSALASMHGWTAAAALERNFRDLITPQQVAKDEAMIEDALAKMALQQYDRNTVYSFESEELRKDGSTFWADVSASFLWSEDGRPIGIIGITRDITERKRAEDSIRESEAKFRALAVSSPSAIFLVQGTRFIYVNPAFSMVTGYTIDDLVKINFWDVVHPDSKETVAKRGLGRLRGENLPPRYEIKLLTKDGRTRWVDYSASVIEVDNKPTIMGSAFDITERKSAEQELRAKHEELSAAYQQLAAYDKELAKNYKELSESQHALRKSEERYRNIFENAVMGIFHTTREGRYLRANPAGAKMYGYESAEDMIQSVTDMAAKIYVDPEDRARFREIMGSEGRVENFESEHYRKDGSKIWTVLNSRAVHDNSGRTLYYETTIEDISKRKLLETQLRQTQKMEAIGTLAGGIAHDFNNILSAIIGYTDMALTDHKMDARLRHYFEQVLKAGERARELVKQILTFSRRSEEKLYPLRISPIVKEVLKLLRAILPATTEIRQEIQCDPDVVRADPTHIHQIMMNLCTNATHAIGARKGKLTVRLMPVEIKAEDTLIHHGLIPGAHIRLTVSDTGHGISAGIMDMIFDPFFTTKKPGEGTGMGLSVVHGIVKSYGGAITVRSEVGKGTEFDVYLPLLMETDEWQKKTAVDIEGGDECILFVDDEEALVSLGKDMLSSLGYKVTIRTSSVEALELFRNNPNSFDIVITDMTMPNMTGIELAQELLRIRPDTPVILCTGFSEAITPDRAKGLGIKDFVMKPVVKNQIASAVRKVLHEKKWRKNTESAFGRSRRLLE
ncbi:MAG TPA: PAS domain S-box protein [Syntrophales bacterium]|nr:PAS domain S-box protein [Syntrophales bacterium]